jgi:hypothetical protein
MAANAGVIVSDIQDWVIDTDIADTLLWGLMDEVIDDIMGVHDPWFCFNQNSVSRTAANHMNDSDLVPPAYEDGVLAVDADIVSGATVPDNSEYLECILFPDGLRKPIDVYSGAQPSLSDNIQLGYIGYEEFRTTYPFNTDGGGSSDAKHYTLYNGTFLVGPNPSLAASLTVYGVYRPSAITANADSNTWITYAASLLKYGVMKKLILYNYEEDGGRYPAISREFRNARNALYSHGKNRSNRVHRPKSRRAGTWRT